MLSKRTPPSRSRLAAVSQPSRRHLAAVSQPSRRRVPRRCLAGASPVLLETHKALLPFLFCVSLQLPTAALFEVALATTHLRTGPRGAGWLWASVGRCIRLSRGGVSVSPTSMKMPPAHHARPCGKVLKGNHATLMDVGHASDGLMPRCATDPEDIVSGPSFLASHCDSSVCSR